MKRYNMPKIWKIERKTSKYVARPRPGPHNADNSIPISLFLRDITGFASTMKEAAEILNKGIVKVDGVVRRSKSFPVGIMDVVTLGDDNFLIYPDQDGINYKKINGKGDKLAKIKNKSIIKKGKTQLNLYNGNNIIVDTDDYTTGDTILIDKESNKIKETLKMEEGSTVILTKGKNVGITGKIKEIIDERGIVLIDNGKKIVTAPKDYVFVTTEEFTKELGEKQ